MDLFDLKGKAALVTGGNGGIGLGMAGGLAKAGANVAIAGRDAAKNAIALKKLLGAIAVTADITDERACRGMVDEAARKLGRLDILINNAGINIRKRPEEYQLEEWHRVLESNLTSAFVACQAAYPHMQRAKGGKIVNIGSMMSIFGASFVAPYGASISPVARRDASSSTANDLRPFGVSVRRTWRASCFARSPVTRSSRLRLCSRRLR